MKIQLVYLFIFISMTVYSQERKAFSFPGERNNKTAQGMAIYKNSAFLFNDEGHCRIYDLKKKQLISEFKLASASKSNHANCAYFGISFPKGNKKYPALYISESSGPSRCFVESIDNNGSQLIQTLQVKIFGNYTQNWFIDHMQECIYTIASTSPDELDSIGSKRYLINKFPLPSLDSISVIFTEKDIIDQFEILFPNLLQGGTIRNNYLYLPVGLHKFPGSEVRKDKDRAIIIVNLKTKQIEKIIDINQSVPYEPEDVDFYKGRLLLYCGQEGGLYEIPVKK